MCYYFFTLGIKDPEGFGKKLKENCRSDHYSGQSSNTKESCRSVLLILILRQTFKPISVLSEPQISENANIAIITLLAQSIIW